tara:strand:+ start:932 stop:2215 length:1284 start_codon:yes stop_codon:yes gene_type:complete
MNRIDNSGQGIASLGRDEDQYMAHVAQGEMVVPPVISQETRQRIEQEMKAAGLSPNEYTVGDGMSINPITGQPEFGWLKKTFKSIKKVAKKVAPVAMLIPGVGTALGGVLGGLGGSIGSAFGLKGTLAKNLLGKIAGAGIPGFSSIAGGAAGGFNSLKGLGSLSGMLKGGPFEGMFTGGQEETMYQDAEGNTYTEAQINKMMDDGTLPQDASFTQVSNFDFKNLLGGGNPGQSKLGLIEDFFKGKSSDAVRDGEGFGGFGGNGGLAALAALYGKATYDAAKDREGGLAATPEITMDNLGRYSIAKNLGKDVSREEFGLGPAPKSLVFASMGGPIDRQYFNQGGIAAVRELDMRDGGESAGPGTGTSDDIPAMLSDGEFVMTAAATKGAGAFNLNKTKSGIELISDGKSSRKKGVENMRELMEIFEAI